MPYLDIVRRVKDRFGADVRLQVSGDTPMLMRLRRKAGSTSVRSCFESADVDQARGPDGILTTSRGGRGMAGRESD